MPFDHERLDERHSGAKALLERIASMLIKLAKSLQGEPPLQDCMKAARASRVTPPDPSSAVARASG